MEITISFLLIFIMILISVYWVKSTYPKIKEWYFNELTKRFIANKNQFLLKALNKGVKG